MYTILYGIMTLTYYARLPGGVTSSLVIITVIISSLAWVSFAILCWVNDETLLQDKMCRHMKTDLERKLDPFIYCLCKQKCCDYLCPTDATPSSMNPVSPEDKICHAMIEHM